MAAPFTIYCHTHMTSGKKYVGQTCVGMEKRWADHVKSAPTKKMERIIFARAILKYGAAAFVGEVLQECAAQDEANVAEVDWIRKLNTRVPNGYNLDAGGKVTKKHALTRAAMSAGARARWSRMSPEQRSALRRSTTTFAQRSSAAIRANASRSPEQRSLDVRRGWEKLTKIQRREIADARNAAMSPEQRSERSRRARMGMTPEARSEQMYKASAGRSPEQRSNSVRKQWLTKSPEERSAYMKALHARRTPEQRSETLRRAWVTRRAKAGEQ